MPRGLAAEIDRHETVGTADFQRANNYRTDARSAELRHAAVGERQPGFGPVFVRANDRGADGLHIDQFVRDEIQDEIEIVDHQIEDDTDIR